MITPTEVLRGQLSDAERRAAEACADIIRLETEIRRQTSLKTGDYVKVTEASACEGQYGRIIRLGAPDDLLPYHVDVLPYHTKVLAYSVQPASAAEVAEFLRTKAEEIAPFIH